MSLALATKSFIDYSFVCKYERQTEFSFQSNTAKWMLGSFALTTALAPFVWTTTPIQLLDYEPNYGLKPIYEDASPNPRISLEYILPDVELKRADVSEKAELETIFNGLSKIWKDATGGLSLTTRRFSHPTYKAILRLGPEAVPLMLKELQQRPDWWFDALEFLTKENPAKPTDSFEDAVSAWIDWGITKNLIH
jgi:hypothetical protein